MYIYLMPKGIRIEDDVKEAALNDYAAGLSFSQIEGRRGISKPAFSGILAEKAAEDPDNLMTHEVAKWCRENNRSPQVLMRSIVLEERIEELDSSFDEVEEALPFLRTAKGRAVEYAKKGEAYMRIVDETGYTYEALIRTHLKLGKEVEAMDKRVADLTSQEGTLSKENERLAAKLHHLEDLEKVNSSLERLGRRPGEAAATVSLTEEISKRGFSPEKADVVSRELSKLRKKCADPVAKVYELVSTYSGLEGAVRMKRGSVGSLTRQQGRLRSSVGFLRDENASMRDQRRELRLALGRLRKEFGGLNSRYKLREETLERNHTQSRVMAMQEIGEMKGRAKQECERTVNAAKAEATRILEDAESKALERESESGLRVSRLEARAGALRGEVNYLTDTAQELAPKIASAEAMWGFVLKNKPTMLAQIQSLHRSDGIYLNFPLPEEARRVFIDAVDNILTADRKARLEQEEGELRRVKQTSAQLLRETFAVKERGEARVDILVRFRSKLKQTEGVLDKVMKEVVSDPALISDALSRSSDGFLVDALAKVSVIQRVRIRHALGDADRKASQEFNWNFEKWMNAQVIGMMRDLQNPFPMPPRLPMVPLPGQQHVSEPVIRDGKVQYDEFGLPRYWQRIIPFVRGKNR